ncbi:WG repeat-containing protein [Neglectibacter caecimuris]|uniref:WG repeat-containing protein n=1 Tax=Neglectibacter caecimuris TaxID=3093658 RepID=UPI002AC9082C|nr:WG repeat-containing protein [Neglectibacter sp. M00184]
MKKGKKLVRSMLALLLLLALGCPRPAARAAETITAKELIPPNYDDVMDFSEGMAAVCIGEDWGFIDTTGQEVVPPRYLDVKSFCDGLAIVLTGSYPDEKWGAVDKTGAEVVPLKYNEMRDFSEGMAAVELDGKWGFVDKTGEEVIPPQYNAVKSFSGGLAAVCTGNYPNEKWGFIDTAGQEVTPQKYEQVRESSEGLTAVCMGKHPDEKWGFVDTAGREVVPLQYDYVKNFSEGLAVVKLNGKWGFVDQTGAEVIPLQYDGGVGSFSNGLARITQDGKWGFIDRTGAIMVQPKYDMVMDFSEGMAAVCVGEGRDKKWGFINTVGEEVVEPRYTAVESFSEGMAVVHTHSLLFIDGPACSGFIDKTGAEVIPVKGNYCVESFSHGLALVRNGTFFGEYGFLDKTGEEVVPLIYQEARSVSGGFAAVGVGESRGYADKWGFLMVETSTEPDPTPTITPAPAPPSAPTPAPGFFIDVKLGSYYYDAVQWAVENNITSGVDSVHFGPSQSCTRAQAVTFLWRAAGEPEPQGAAAGFTDVKAGAYYEKAVQWAVEEGITAGTGAGKFGPEVPCTRGQIVTFLWRKEGSPEAVGAAFGDVPPGAYYETAVKWAVEKKITAGTSATAFSPESKCTRAQIVSFLYRSEG